MILTLLGVYEECIVSWVPITRLGLFRRLNPIRSCFNVVRIWWIIYKFLQEEDISLTCNNTISVLHKNKNTYNTFTLLLYLWSYIRSRIIQVFLHKLAHNHSIIVHIVIRIIHHIITTTSTTLNFTS